MPISRRPSCTRTYPIEGDVSCTSKRTRTRGGAGFKPMMTHSLTLVLSAAGVGYLMVKAGLAKNALEPKHRRRVCPSCGRVISGRRCDAH
jgi:hypothetical protein